MSLKQGVRLFAGFFLALGCCLAAAEQTILEVITLNYRTADELIPVLLPLLPPEGSVSGMQNRLIVRSTPANLQQLREILSVLDAKPRQLVISVRQDADVASTRKEVDISGTISIDDQARVTAPSRASPRPGVDVQIGSGNSHVRAQINDEMARSRQRVSQQVRVLEGRSAFVRVGQSAPVQQRQVVQTPDGSQSVESTSFADATTGFYVLPRVAGDRVTLEISTQNDHFSVGRRDAARRPATIDLQHADTVVSGRLGEWIDIGGIDVVGSRYDEAILGRRDASTRAQRRIMLKVEEVR